MLAADCAKQQSRRAGKSSFVHHPRSGRRKSVTPTKEGEKIFFWRNLCAIVSAMQLLRAISERNSS
jgi:hypothetical protein